MQIDVNTLTCANFRLSNWFFFYHKFNYEQRLLVLHLASIDKAVWNLRYFVHNFQL